MKQRVTGDELLDAQDLIEEIKSVGANVDKNGYVTVYHQTTNESADKIKQSGKMIAKEPFVYFSTSKGASQSDGRGNTKLEFKIPAEKLILDDIFDDNADVKVKLDNSKELDISSYLVNNNNNLDFSQQIDKVIEGTYPKNDMLVVLDNTPEVLRNIGLNNYPITLTQRHLNTIMNEKGNYKNANYHNLGAELVKKIPEALSKPLNVLQSDTDSNSIVVITNLADSHDRPIIASIRIDGKGNINNVEIDSNVMTSAYGRNNYDQFMQRNIKKGNLLYDIDEGIIKRIGGKLQLRPTNSTDINVPQSSTNVNSSTTKYSISKTEKNTNELDDSSFSLDSQGRKLSKEQQDYFKDSKVKDIYINEFIKGGNSSYFDSYTDYSSTINEMDAFDWVEGEDLKEWLEENHPEYDGLILDEDGTGGYGLDYEWRGMSYIPFYSNQIKKCKQY